MSVDAPVYCWCGHSKEGHRSNNTCAANIINSDGHLDRCECGRFQDAREFEKELIAEFPQETARVNRAIRREGKR